MLEETIDDGSTPVLKTYTIGDDILSQAEDSGSAEHLLYDGHGSTRQLMASNGSTINDSFSYDGYGVMLGGNPTSVSSPATNLLYSGEYFDTDVQNYYLRARWYNSLAGRFNRKDPFEGNNLDPQSLHKYTYAHNNPINNIDPSGETTTVLELNIGMAIMVLLTGIIAIDMIQYSQGRASMTGALIKTMQLAAEYAAAGMADIAVMINQNARKIGKALRRAARAIKQTVKDILKQKPFFVWERATPNIYRFTVSCLALNPIWYCLTWHADPVRAATNRAWVMAKYGHLRRPGYGSIDEFPYASTVQGGPPSAIGCAVPWIENCVQGGYLKAHYYGILKKPMTKFIVVPVPK